MGDIFLRPANIEDLDTLNFWDRQKHVIDSDPNDDWNWEIELVRNPFWRELLIAELNKEPLGFIQIIDPYYEETHYLGSVEKGIKAIDIWIGEENNLGKGYGTQMMNLAIERCFNNPGIKYILIDPLASNTKAHKFYERLGFVFLEERWFGEDFTYVYRLNRMDVK